MVPLRGGGGSVNGVIQVHGVWGHQGDLLAAEALVAHPIHINLLSQEEKVQCTFCGNRFCSQIHKELPGMFLESSI